MFFVLDNGVIDFIVEDELYVVYFELFVFVNLKIELEKKYNVEFLSVEVSYFLN